MYTIFKGANMKSLTFNLSSPPDKLIKANVLKLPHLLTYCNQHIII